MSASPHDPRQAHLDAWAVFWLVTCAALWGLNQAATKVALLSMPPLLQAGARSAGAALLLAVWSAWRGTPLGLGGAHWRGGLLAGALFAAEFGCIFVGLQHTSASRIVVFIYLAPFVVALGMAWVDPAERLRPLQTLGLAGAFGGVVWAFAEGLHAPSAGGRQWLGDALGAVAALLWGGTTLAIRATGLSRAPAETTLMYQLLVSAVLLGGAGLLWGERWPDAPGAAAWAALGFQTVVVTFASYLLWFWLMRHYPATQISAFTLLTPVFGLAAGVGLLGEPLTLRLGVALAAVVGGLALMHGARPARDRPD